MSVVASCPHCSKTSEVREELVGQKVRCKRCRTKFIVEGNLRTTKRSGSTATLTPSGGMKRPKKSNAKVWVVLSVVTVLFLGVGGTGLWVAMRGEAAKPAKASARGATVNAVIASNSVNDEADRKAAKSKDAKSLSPTDAARNRAPGKRRRRLPRRRSPWAT